MILERLVGNPVHIYCLVERLVRQLPAIRKTLSEDMETADIAEEMNRMLEKVDMVGEEDLVGDDASGESGIGDHKYFGQWGRIRFEAFQGFFW